MRIAALNDTEGKREPPHSIEAEMSVLGSMMLDAEVAPEVIAIVESAAFYDPRHSLIFDAIIGIYQTHRKIDLVTLKAELVRRGTIEVVGGIEYCESLVVQVPTSAHATEYARIVRDCALRRRALDALPALEEALRGVRFLNGEADAARHAIDALAQATDDGQRVIAEEAPTLFKRTPDGVDFIIEPVLAKGCLTQLQGNPKCGKSCFAFLLALSCAIGRWMAGRFEFVGGPRRTLFITYEDSLRRLKRRAREYLPGLGAADSPSNLLLFARPPNLDLTTPAGRTCLESIVSENRVDVVIIDTLSWISGDADENAKGQMQVIMACLRRIIEKFSIAVLVVHHTRKTTPKGDVASVSERGRGSSAIAAAADVILDWGTRIAPGRTLCRLVSKDSEDDEFEVHYQRQEDGSILWKLEAVAEREDAVELKNRILTAVRELGATSSEIGFALIQGALPDVPSTTLRGYVAALVSQKQLVILEKRGPRGAKLYVLGM